MQIERVKRDRYIPAYCLAILMAAVAMVRLALLNPHVLFQFQEQQLFMSGWDFFRETMHRPGGPFTWAGLYLQQYFYYPVIGAAMLALVWVCGFLTSVRAFRLRGVLSAVAVLPVAGLMSALLCTGYWIYVFKVPEYAFTPSLMYLASMLVCLGLCRLRLAVIWQSLVCIIYMLFGLWWLRIAMVPETLRITFYVSFFSALLFGPVSLIDRWSLRLPFAVGVIFALGASLFLWFYTGANTYRSDAYRIEMVMSRAIEEGRWQDAVDAAQTLDTGSAVTKATRQVWLMRQVALMNLGKMGSELYAYTNNTVLPRATAGVKVHMVEVGGPLLYFMNGRTHFAYRWCMENMVEYGPSVARLRLMTMCAIVNAEDDLARRYLGILSRTRFYRKWATEQYALLEDRQQIEKSEPYRISNRFQSDLTNVTDGDNGLCELFLTVSYGGRKGVKDPLLSELCLNYAMIQMNPVHFWMQFMNYVELNGTENIPLYYRQAAALYSIVDPFSTPDADLDALGVDESLRSSVEKLLADVRSKAEKGISVESLARQTYPEYGHSYFWFYLFCQDNTTY